MSSEIHDLNDLSRQILRLLISGMQTTDQVKSQGFLHRDEIAARLNLPIDAIVEDLAVLESLGYISNQHAYGGDPTMTYKGIEEHSAVGARDLENPTYYITDWGKRLVAAEVLSDMGSSATPPS